MRFLISWKQTLQTDALVLADQVENNIYPTINKSGVQKITDESSKLMSVRITVVDPNGNVIGDSEKNPDELTNHRNRPEIITALTGLNRDRCTKKRVTRVQNAVCSCTYQSW